MPNSGVSPKVRAATADQRCYILRHGSEPAGSAKKYRERTSLPGGPFQIRDERPGDRLELARRGKGRDDAATKPTDPRCPPICKASMKLLNTLATIVLAAAAPVAPVSEQLPRG